MGNPCSVGCDSRGRSFAFGTGNRNAIALVAFSCMCPVGREVESPGLDRPTAKNTIVAGSPVLVIVAVDCRIPIPIPTVILRNFVDLVPDLLGHVIEIKECID